MDWQKNLIGITWLAVGILLLIIVISAGVFWPQLDSEGRASLSLAAIGAGGTLVLAGATATSVLQSRQEVNELQLTREKPLAGDELQNVVQPSINAISMNLERLQSEDGVEWGYVEPPHGFSGGRLLSAFPEPDLAAMHRLREDDRETWNLMKRHNSIVGDIAEFVKESKIVLEDAVFEYLDEHDVDDRELVEDELSRVLNAILMDLEAFGDSSSLYEFWEIHGLRLRDLLSDERREKLNRMEEEYEEICQELLENLNERKLFVQQKYGISSAELPVDEDPRWREV